MVYNGDQPPSGLMTRNQQETRQLVLLVFDVGAGPQLSYLDTSNTRSTS